MKLSLRSLILGAILLPFIVLSSASKDASPIDKLREDVNKMINERLAALAVQDIAQHEENEELRNKAAKEAEFLLNPKSSRINRR